MKSAGDEDLRVREAVRRHQERDYFYKKYEKPEEDAAKEEGKTQEADETRKDEAPSPAPSPTSVEPVGADRDVSR